MTADAAVVLVADAAGRVLLQLRDDRPDVAHAGLWGPFGGGVEPGETARAAAMRELHEETGLLVAQGDLRFVCAYASTGGRRVEAFACRLEVGPGDIRLGEGAGFGFFLPAQIGGLRQTPSLGLVLDAYLAEG